MISKSHLKKAIKIERSIKKLKKSDWEIKIEGSMLAATHRLNHQLHKKGITQSKDDIIHLSMTSLSLLRKLKIVTPKTIKLLNKIEEMRPLFVRGDTKKGKKYGNKAIKILNKIQKT